MLSVRDLVKVYPGPVTALQGVQLDLSPGMFGLLGPNGAGKSTFMRILAGLLEPTSGSVTLDGADIIAHPEMVRAKLGYLPQEFGFYPHLTGEQMLLHLLRLKGVTAQGGIGQRLGIAQAIAGDPRLVIVDEPTAGLDPEERLRFYHLLAELAENRIVVLSTHIVEDVAVLCPQFAVIRSGRLIVRTTPRAAREAIAGAIFEGTVQPADLPELRRVRHVTQAILVEGRHRVRVYAPAGDPPAGFEPATPTLEDAYLVLMRTEGLEAGNGARSTSVPLAGDRAGAHA